MNQPNSGDLLPAQGPGVFVVISGAVPLIKKKKSEDVASFHPIFPGEISSVRAVPTLAVRGRTSFDRGRSG